MLTDEERVAISLLRCMAGTPERQGDVLFNLLNRDLAERIAKAWPIAGPTEKERFLISVEVAVGEELRGKIDEMSARLERVMSLLGVRHDVPEGT